MEPLDLTRLTPLMKRTAGNRRIVVALVDGPVDMSNANLAIEAFREMAMKPPMEGSGCSYPQGVSCRHGTFVAGILAAKRGSNAPAICPECTFLMRPIFLEQSAPQATPSATCDELAAAIREMVDAGANVVNLSCELARGTSTRLLKDTLDYAAARGAICVAAAGNSGLLGGSAITGHYWVIPVAACNSGGRPTEGSNLGHSVGLRGLLAPGEAIRSLGPEVENLPMDGTSSAAPFVAGTAALLWSEFPEASATEIRQALAQSGGARRNSVVPPLLDAWSAYLSLSSHFGRAA
jgi:subtilisin family serine protease